ncbi:MAG TPA: hypothetical protein VF520_15215 [Thermoleophilaceae bacterium]
MRRLDAAQAAAVGIAAATAALVAGGLLLSALGALDSTGWVVVVLGAGALAVLAGARDPARLLAPVMLAFVALGLAAGAIALSRASAVDQARETRFTQLWLVERGSAGRAEIGVRNEEHRRTELRLRVFGPASAGGRPLLDRKLALAPAQTWSAELSVPRTPRPERVNAELYRAGETEPYRSVHVWTSPGGP